MTRPANPPPQRDDAQTAPPDQPPAGQPPLDQRRRRILFRATHRGTHETDILVGGYVAAHIATLDQAELDELERVMELPDTDLADWICGRRPIPLECDTPILRAMRRTAIG